LDLSPKELAVLELPAGARTAGWCPRRPCWNGRGTRRPNPFSNTVKVTVSRLRRKAGRPAGDRDRAASWIPAMIMKPPTPDHPAAADPAVRRAVRARRGRAARLHVRPGGEPTSPGGVAQVSSSGTFLHAGGPQWRGSGWVATAVDRPVTRQQVGDALKTQVAIQRATELRQLLVVSGIALVIVAALSVALGVAGGRARAGAAAA